MSKQEIFDKVARHLLSQQRVALDARNKCAYRGLDGAKCAVGCLIPDELYDPKMEGETADTLLSRFPGVLDSALGTYVAGDVLELLQSLQYVHDSCEIDEWPERLAMVANEHDLECRFQ